MHKQVILSYLSHIVDFNTVYGEELYDHSFDPDENMNLALRRQFKDFKAELLKLLRINF